ncbi:MAG: response regulator [Granulosicoccaceae bacterium]
MKVMIVDDSKSMRLIVKRTLKQAGYDSMEFSEAEDGSQALATIDDIGPHLVLCDWNMPVMNGIEFLKALREAGNAVKFGFVTTESTNEMRSLAKEAGAQFLVAKPFTPESFQKALRPVIGA